MLGSDFRIRALSLMIQREPQLFPEKIRCHVKYFERALKEYSARLAVYTAPTLAEGVLRFFIAITSGVYRPSPRGFKNLLLDGLYGALTGPKSKSTVPVVAKIDAHL